MTAMIKFVPSSHSNCLTGPSGMSFMSNPLSSYSVMLLLSTLNCSKNSCANDLKCMYDNLILKKVKGDGSTSLV